MIPLKKILERKEIGRKEFSNICARSQASLINWKIICDHGGVMLDSNMIYGSPADDKIFLHIFHWWTWNRI